MLSKKKSQDVAVAAVAPNHANAAADDADAVADIITGSLKKQRNIFNTIQPNSTSPTKQRPTAATTAGAANGTV